MLIYQIVDKIVYVDYELIEEKNMNGLLYKVFVLTYINYLQLY